ncbi:Chemotaxis protein cheA [Candidatus Magnetomorum sp. HK-1]|nr:Chemotaxis protein cheA [Candidatus Magnetomorum sp. HK-1]
MDQDSLKRQLLDTFKMELDEHVMTLNKGILRLEQGITGNDFDALMAELFRAAHSLKGASRTVDILDINLIAHRMEDVLGLIQHKKIQLTGDLFDLLFQAVDLIKEAMRMKLKGESLPFDQLNAIVEKLESATVMNETFREKVQPEIQIEYAKLKPDNTKKREKRKFSPKIIDEQPKNESIEKDKKTNALPIEELKDTQNALPSEKLKDTQITSSDDTIRVKTNKLDMLMASMGELMGSRMRTMQRMTELQLMQKRMNRWYKEWRQIRGHMKSLERKHDGISELDRFFEFMHGNAENLKQVHGDMNFLVRQFMNDCDQFSFVTDDLQDKIRNVRMQPISSLFDQFPRMVRDLSKNQNKKIRLDIFGEKTEVDRHVLDALKDPLTHILRNAVDHGIESPDVRKKIGKPPTGLIQLKAAQKGSTIVIKVIDDGRGIDLESVKNKAVEQKLLPQQKAQALSKRELTELIFCSGLSTQSTITDISGRGVGLDVVRRNLEKLQGQILVESQPNEGTTLKLTVSLSLATSQVLMVKVDGELLAIPCTTVERILKIHPDELGQIEGKPAIVVDNEALPLFTLAPLLDFSDSAQLTNENQKIAVIVLIVAEKRLAFRVDELLETREIVIKNMGQQLRRVRNLSGATILGDGQIVMVLNVSDLMKSAQKGAAYQSPISVAPPPPEKKHILVVDDSITTRTLEKNILDNAGYDVVVCADGQEAWECIQSQFFDAVVSDVDMPRMNGFQLASHVKSDDRYKNLPFILVTSLESRADKVRGMEVGADAYIVKGTFDQKELLGTIERLIG